jgi:predicted alpha/beta superfamily hydrolase
MRSVTTAFAAGLALAVVTLGAALAEPAPASGPAAVKGIRPSEVVIPFTRRIDFTSTVNGQDYTLYVGLPVTPAPQEGYRVVYVLDGVAYFGTATEAARGAGAAVVVVGVLYPFDDAGFIARTLKKPERDAVWPDPSDDPGVIDRTLRRSKRASVSLLDIERAIQVTRTYDLTPPTSDAYMKAQKIPGFPDMKAGGADAFLKVIETEIKPRIHALVKVDPGDETLYGHSLGGLAVLRALFTEPSAFRTFVAASPSIWWNDKSVLEGEAGFAQKVAAGAVAPRVLITVGGLEQTPAPVPPGAPLKQEEADAMTKRARMVDNAVELGQRLAALKGAPGYEVKTVVFADETHGSVEQAALSRAIAFADKGADLKP